MISSVSRDRLIKTLLTRTPVDHMTRNHGFAWSLISCVHNFILRMEPVQTRGRVMVSHFCSLLTALKGEMCWESAHSPVVESHRVMSVALVLTEGAPKLTFLYPIQLMLVASLLLSLCCIKLLCFFFPAASTRWAQPSGIYELNPTGFLL